MARPPQELLPGTLAWLQSALTDPTSGTLRDPLHRHDPPAREVDETGVPYLHFTDEQTDAGTQ